MVMPFIENWLLVNRNEDTKFLRLNILQDPLFDLLCAAGKKGCSVCVIVLVTNYWVLSCMLVHFY
jgi:hypothetical protein